VDEGTLRRLALRQHGVVSREQVLAADGTDRTIERQLRLGRWERARGGIYVVGAAPPTWERDAIAATLAAGPGAHLTERSAARLWGLVERSGRMQLLIDGRRRVRLPDVDVHRTTRFEPVDRSTLAGIPVTSLARSLIELAPSQSTDAMGPIVDAAMRLHGLDLEHLATRIDDLIAPGRRRPQSLIDALLLRTPGYDPGRSALESRTVAAIAGGGLPAPLRQHPVIRPDGREAFIDLAYPPPMVAIEVDGFAFHSSRAAFDADRIRRNELVLLGWDVLHVTSAMSNAEICRVVRLALGL
jgi:hypothetical protein